MSSSRHLRAGLATAAVASLAVAGLGAAAPAFAASSPAPATLQLHVTDGEGNSLGDVAVIALGETNNRYVDFGATDDDGNLLLTSGGHYGSPHLVAGTYDLEIGDNSVDRYKSDSLFAPLSKEPVTIKAGVNDLGDVPLAAGGIAAGTVETPSGHPLRGLSLDVETQSEDEGGDFFDYGFGYETTFGNGSFEVPALAVGDYNVHYDASDGVQSENDEDYDYRPAGSFTIDSPGQKVTADYKVRVASTPAATTVYGISPTKGQVELVFKIANTRYGITDPHGTVTVTTPAGTAKGEPTPVTAAIVKDQQTGRAIIDFPASSGTRQYVVRYGNTSGDADLLNTSRTVTVKVK